MTHITWRHVAAMLVAGWGLGGGASLGAPTFTQDGDGSFRNITATGGALPGVNVSGALVQINGSSASLASVAMQAANALPVGLAGQPNGWLKLDGNGLVPLASLPASVSSPDDAVARASAAAAVAVAAASVPAGAANKPNGYAQLDVNALVPLALLPASVTSPTDATARAAANSAQMTASAAQMLAAAAVPSSAANKASGFAQLDSNALVPLALLPASGIAAGACAKASFDVRGRAVTCGSLVGSDIPVDGTTIGVNTSNSLSVIGGSVDSTARNEAAAAQTVANAAIPLSTLGHASGPAQLDANALVSPALLDLVNQPSGPVAEDQSGTVSAAQIQASGAAAVKRALSVIEGDVIKGADYGMKCDEGSIGDISATAGTNEFTVPTTEYVFSAADVGRWFDGGYQFGTNVPLQITSIDTVHNGAILGGTNFTFSGAVTSVEGQGGGTIFTDDTAALQATVAQYVKVTASMDSVGSGGAEIELPRGSCAISGEIDIPASASLRLRGAGLAATQLIWWKPTNGLIITMNNRASVTLDDFKIAKLAGTNSGGSEYQGIALKIGGSTTANGVIQNGITTENNLMIQASDIDGDDTDGWAAGDQLENQTNPVVVNVSVHNAGLKANPTGLLPSPFNLVATPAAYAAGNGSDFWFDGQGGAGIDGTFVGLTAEDGVAGFDISGFVQGAYIADSRFVYAPYGLRADNLTAAELIIFTANHVNAFVDDIYNDGMGDSQFNGNFMFRAGAAGDPWVGIWNRNGDDNEMVGNGMNGSGAQYGSTTVSTALATGQGGAGSTTPLLVGSVSGFISGGLGIGDMVYDLTTPSAIPLGDEINVTSANSVYLTALTTQAIPANDQIVSAVGVSPVSAAVPVPTSGSTTTIPLVSTAGFEPGESLIDFSNASVFSTPQPVIVSSVSSNGIVVSAKIAATLAARDVLGGYYQEFGIFSTNDSQGGFGGFPQTIGSNSLSSIGGCAIGNNQWETAMAGVGNSIINATRAVCDYTANGQQWGTNQYVLNDVNGQPALIDDGYRNLLADVSLTIGSYANQGKLTVQDWLGTGSIVNQTVTDSSTGLTCMNYNTSMNHNICSGAFAAYGGSGGGTLTLATGNGSTFPVFKAGTATVYGELSCSTTGFEVSWRIEGHYATNGTTDTPGGFSAVAEADGDTQYALGGTAPRLSGTTAITPQLSTSGVGLQVVTGSGTGGNWSCTSDLHEELVN